MTAIELISTLVVAMLVLFGALAWDRAANGPDASNTWRHGDDR